MGAKKAGAVTNKFALRSFSRREKRKTTPGRLFFLFHFFAAKIFMSLEERRKISRLNARFFFQSLFSAFWVKVKPRVLSKKKNNGNVSSTRVCVRSNPAVNKGQAGEIGGFFLLSLDTATNGVGTRQAIKSDLNRT